MSNWPLNAEVLQGIAHTGFYGALAIAETERLYTKICHIIDQSDLSVTYTSFGNTPEPRQLSGTVASTGERQSYGMKDYKITGTVVEWEQTIEVPRSVIETNPGEIGRITSQMAQKASLFMDRRLIGTVLPAATAGYDGAALYSDAGHTESGTAQDNNLAGTSATGTKPSAAEIESDMDTVLGTLKGFKDDRSTPVNEGVGKFIVLVPLAFEYLFKNVLETPPVGSAPFVDSSGASGRFRGMFTVYGSSFVATDDRHYMFTDRTDSKSVALLKNKPFEFVTNIGTDSDMWRLNQMAVFSSYARFEFIPWDWKTTVRVVYS